MQIASRTHIGLVRTKNQDTLILGDGLYGVADGMGGHRGGETASLMTAQVVRGALSGHEPDPTLLASAVRAANRRVYETQKFDASLSGMGTTCTLLWEKPESVLVAHVGDSRAYLLRSGKFKQITQDHSIVAEMIREGLLTAEQARTHPYRNVITRAVGTSPAIDVDLLFSSKLDDDVWLLCSDGLHNMVDDGAIARELAETSLETAADRLLALALEAGATDNISFVLLRVAEGSV